MAKHKIEIDEKCKSCDGTGLYSGIGEDKGVAVQCYKCKGTGCYHFVHEYEVFQGRLPAKNIEWVIQTNPGIHVGCGNGFKFQDFGGMSYEDWNQGKPFEVGMEMRRFTCPAWWYQGIDYSKKPRWDWCPGWGTFSQCQHFEVKEKCWKRWDEEYK